MGLATLVDLLLEGNQEHELGMSGVDKRVQKAVISLNFDTNFRYRQLASVKQKAHTTIYTRTQETP